MRGLQIVVSRGEDSIDQLCLACQDRVRGGCQRILQPRTIFGNTNLLVLQLQA